MSLVTTNVASGSTAITNIPTAASPLYTGADPDHQHRASPRAQLSRARPGFFPGPPHTESYVKLAAAAATFTSDLPVILLHNLAGGSVPQTTDQNVIVMVFEPVNGRTSLTNPPTLVTRAGFNIRGSSTAVLPQSSFALEIWDEYNQDRKVAFLGMPAESDWVLYGQNRLRPLLPAQPARPPALPGCRALLVTDALRRGVPEHQRGADHLYRRRRAATTSASTPSRRRSNVAIAALTSSRLNPRSRRPPAITGGYLLKIDRADSNERTFYDPYLQGNIVFQDPPGLEMVDSARQAQRSYITDYFAQFGAALWGASYTNPLTGYAAYIDVDSWVDHHILNVLAYNVDALRLSGYFFKDRGEKIEMGPLWDFDRSMGTYNPGFDAWDNRCFNPSALARADQRRSGDRLLRHIPPVACALVADGYSPIPTSGSDGSTAGPTCGGVCSLPITCSPRWTAWPAS